MTKVGGVAELVEMDPAIRLYTPLIEGNFAEKKIALLISNRHLQYQILIFGLEGS